MVSTHRTTEPDFWSGLLSHAPGSRAVFRVTLPLVSVSEGGAAEGVLCSITAECRAVWILLISDARLTALRDTPAATAIVNNETHMALS
jgi:hypothetical protein